MGTAADLWIEENLAIAARRGKHRSLRWAIKASERANFKKMLEGLDLGLENRLSTEGGAFVGRDRGRL